MTRLSLFEFAGGHDAMLALATACTERCMQDPELSHAFSHGMDPNHDQHLAAYWAEVLGGPPSYSESLGGHSGMLALHAAQGAPDEWGDRFEDCFVAAMDDAGLPRDPEFRKAMGDYMHWATREVNFYSPPGSTVKPNLPMPRWSWHGLVETDGPNQDDRGAGSRRTAG
jgi:hemoglobin